MTPTTPITMRADELGRLISRYVEVGYSMAVKLYEPTADNLRRADVDLWLKQTGSDPKLFHKLVSLGYIVARKKGVGKNSPLIYSKNEIVHAMANADINLIGARTIIENRCRAQK